jgi:glutamyl-tRNA reductase
MQHSLKALSLSYKKAPLALRERLSLSEQDIQDFLLKIREMFDISEALVLSTCNRTEVYYVSQESMAPALAQWMAAYKGWVSDHPILDYFEVLDAHADAAEHLFRVGLGLESQVVGDLQITNQVKRAYQASADLDMAGPFLHRLLHTIFFANKRVVQETSFRDGAASVSYAAVEMLEEVTQSMASPKVLVVGVGEIGANVVKNLENTELRQVRICNRTLEKAQALADACGYQAIPFGQVWEAVAEADVIISSLALSDPFFTKEKLERLGASGLKCFFDLSVPRSVSPDVEELPQALVYNVDDINNRTSQALERRKAAIPQVEAIMHEALGELDEWAQSMVYSPTIQKLKQALEQIRQEEMARYMKQLSDEEAGKVDKITRSMMQKIIKLPVLQIKAACKRGEAETLIDVLNNLFNLEATEPQRPAE